MSRLLASTLIVALTFAATNVATALHAADLTPEQILDAAIKAAGGAEAINKQKAMTWDEQGTYYGMGTGLSYTGKYANQWPDKFRVEIVGVFTIVLNGDKGWVKSPNGVEEFSAEQIAERKEEHYGGPWMATLTPLKEKGYKLTAVDGIKIGDRPAVGFKVSHEGRRDVTFYFDKETHLIVRQINKVKSQEQGGKEVTQETTVLDHKEVGGVKMPTKFSVTHDGAKFVEGEMSEMKIVDKLDDATFAKPE